MKKDDMKLVFTCGDMDEIAKMKWTPERDESFKKALEMIKKNELRKKR